MYENLTIGKRLENLDETEAFDGYSRVEIIIDSEHSVSAGAPGGRTLTIENPWGTEEQAQNILNSLQGFQYQPYKATRAHVNPAAELGDGATMNGLYSGIYKISRTYGPLMTADIEAPADEEIEHEYPYETKADREITRKFSAVESEFAIQSNEISAKVSQTGGDASSVSWSLTSTAWTVKANGTEVFKVDRNGATVTGKITATSGKIGGFDIGASAITYNKQTWGGTSVNGIYFGTSGLQIGRKPKNANDNASYFSASASGTIEARNLKLTGTLNIGGTDITAAALRSGAQSAYTNGGTWSGTSTTVDNAFNKNTKVKYLNCTTLTATSAGIDQLTIPYGTRVLLFAGQWITIKSATVDGTTIHYLGY